MTMPIPRSVASSPSSGRLARLKSLNGSLLVGLAVWTGLAGPAWSAAAVPAVSAAAPAGAAQQFQAWSGERWIARSISLTELGFTAPAVLDNSNSKREFYLPVPSGVALSEAALQLNGRYLRADGGRTTMTVSIDGYPVAAKRLPDDLGDASQAVAVDGLPRSTGFVRVGINWSSVLNDLVCTDQRAPGNSLSITPDSRFSYKYERNAIDTLATAWSALPQRPVLLVAERNLSAPAFDTAWRTGVAMERNGKHALVRTLPGVGDLIDLSRTEVPAALLGLPAFAALADHNPKHAIKDQAELGALLVMGEHGPLRADVVITDAALLAGLREAFGALYAQVKAQRPDAADALAALLAANFSVLEAAAGPEQIRLTQFGGNPAITIPAASVAKAAALLGSLWRPTAVGTAITVGAAENAKLDGDTMLLSQFGAIAGTLDVLARTERSVVFDLGAVSMDGRLPDRLSFDLSAAPSINDEAPIASLFINDYLLGAKKLVADGSAQRVTVAIPRYVLSARNEVRIAFLRQPTQVRCHDTPMAYPVSILPGSHIHLGEAPRKNDFIGMASQYGGASSLLVPDSWLAAPGASLPQLIRIADAAGLPVTRTSLQLVPAGQNGKPNGPFLALDVALDGYQPGAALHSGKLILQGNAKAPLLDLNGVERVATAEVISASGQNGIAYRNVGKQPTLSEAAFRLTNGNLAVLGNAGPLLQLNMDDPNGARTAALENPESLWERYMTLWLVLAGVLVLMMLVARVVHVKRRNKP